MTEQEVNEAINIVESEHLRIVKRRKIIRWAGDRLGKVLAVSFLVICFHFVIKLLVLIDRLFEWLCSML